MVEVFEFLRREGKKQEGKSGFLISMQQMPYFTQGILEGRELIPVEDVYIGDQYIATNYMFGERKKS